MLYTKEGHTRVEGSTVTILSDLTSIIKSVKECLEEHYGEEFAREKIALCGQYAFMDESDVASLVDERITTLSDLTGIEVSDLKEMLENVAEKFKED